MLPRLYSIRVIALQSCKPLCGQVRSLNNPPIACCGIHNMHGLSPYGIKDISFFCCKSRWLPDNCNELRGQCLCKHLHCFWMVLPGCHIESACGVNNATTPEFGVSPNIFFFCERAHDEDAIAFCSCRGDQILR